MLLNRGKSQLEASMEHALFRVEDIPQVIESFRHSQKDISQGRLENLVASLNDLHDVVFKETLNEKDFSDIIFMTNENVLSSYASATGFYPYAVGFIFPRFGTIVAKLLHAPRGTRGFYINKNFFRQRPFLDTGLVFVDQHKLNLTFMHYHELTSSTQFQYSKSHLLGEFEGPSQLRLIYEVELALLRELISVYVQNKELSHFRRLNLKPLWNDFWESLKIEYRSNYLPTINRMILQSGGTVPRNITDDLTKKINDICDLMKSLLNSDTKEVVNIFFRLGTIPNDMRAGKLYSPLNDLLVYFR